MTSNAAKLFEYMSLIGKLKRVRRAGWVLRGVKDAESVSDHMYRVAMTAFLAPPPLNADKCVKMALVHDMAECIVGDLTPHDNVSKTEKHSREKEATQHMCSLVGDPLGSQLMSLWQEYESQDSEEARFVKDLDRLDMVLQAFEYEQRDGCPGRLQEFFDSTAGKFNTDTVRGWSQHLDDRRGQHSHPGEDNSTSSADVTTLKKDNSTFHADKTKPEEDNSTSPTDETKIPSLSGSAAARSSHLPPFVSGGGDNSADGDSEKVKRRKNSDSV